MAEQRSTSSEFFAQRRAVQDQGSRPSGAFAAQVHQRVDGHDSSGCLTVSLADDGLPDMVRVSADWSTRIGAAGFSGAVLEAARDASARRAVLLSQSRQMPPGQTDDRDVPVAGASNGPADRPPPLRVLVEEAICELEKINQLPLSTFAPATGTGTDGGENLSVTLSQEGLVSCTAASEYWLVRQGGQALGSALTGAVAAARVDLARALAEPDPSARMDQLFNDLLTVLTSGRYNVTDRTPAGAGVTDRI
jgi:hypothetical protein